MKKTVSIILTLVMLVCVLANSFSAFAAVTVDNVIEKASESAIYHYLETDIKNLAKSVKLTDDQLDKLYDVAERFVALKIEDKGATAHEYTKEEITNVLALVDEACEILGYKYEITNAASSKHPGDIDFKIYDENNKVVYTYDGDVVNKTGADNSALFMTVAVAGCALLIAAVVFAVKTKKKVA